MNWSETLERLALIASKGCQREEWVDSFDFGLAELRRVGNHLDSLPERHQLPEPLAVEIERAERAMVEPEYRSQP